MSFFVLAFTEKAGIIFSIFLFYEGPKRGPSYDDGKRQECYDGYYKYYALRTRGLKGSTPQLPHGIEQVKSYEHPDGIGDFADGLLLLSALAALALLLLFDLVLYILVQFRSPSPRSLGSQPFLYLCGDALSIYAVLVDELSRRA